MKKTGPKDRSFPFQIYVDQRFLFAEAAALFTASLVASLASPTAFWPLPFNSWITPSPCRRSEPVASPMPCLALPIASLVVPLILSAVAPIGTLLCAVWASQRQAVGHSEVPLFDWFAITVLCTVRNPKFS